MLWKTHIRIGFEVIRRMGVSLSGEENSAFKEGLIAPDKNRRNFESHHFGKSTEITSSILKSRAYFLEDSMPLAFFHLGIALHYIQDSFVSVPSYSSPSNQEWHHNWEQSIENSQYITNIEREIQYLFREDFSKLTALNELARNLSIDVNGKEATLNLATLGIQILDFSAKPAIDFNLAFLASHAVTKSVLKPKTNLVLESELNNLLVCHKSQLRIAESNLAKEISKLVLERDELRKRRLPPKGMTTKVKNWTLGARIWFKNKSASSQYKKYVKHEHLAKVVRKYSEAANQIVYAHRGWYDFQIPRLSLDICKELLLVQEVAKVLGQNEKNMERLFNKCNIPTYLVGKRELVRREDLNRYLSQFPLPPSEPTIGIGLSQL